MKLKKVGILAIVLVLAVITFVSTNPIDPPKTEAIVIDAHYIWQVLCCSNYAGSCPPKVMDQCYDDCMAWGDCAIQN